MKSGPGWVPKQLWTDLTNELHGKRMTLTLCVMEVLHINKEKGFTLNHEMQRKSTSKPCVLKYYYGTSTALQ